MTAANAMAAAVTIAAVVRTQAPGSIAADATDYIEHSGGEKSDEKDRERDHRKTEVGVIARPQTGESELPDGSEPRDSERGSRDGAPIDAALGLLHASGISVETQVPH